MISAFGHDFFPIYAGPKKKKGKKKGKKKRKEEKKDIFFENTSEITFKKWRMRSKKCFSANP